MPGLIFKFGEILPPGQNACTLPHERFDKPSEVSQFSVAAHRAKGPVGGYVRNTFDNSRRGAGWEFGLGTAMASLSANCNRLHSYMQSIALCQTDLYNDPVRPVDVTENISGIARHRSNRIAEAVGRPTLRQSRARLDPAKRQSRCG